MQVKQRDELRGLTDTAPEVTRITLHQQSSVSPVTSFRPLDALFLHRHDSFDQRADCGQIQMLACIQRTVTADQNAKGLPSGLARLEEPTFSTCKTRLFQLQLRILRHEGMCVQLL